MESKLHWLPIVVLASIIVLSSELLLVPAGTPWFSAYMQLDSIAHFALYFVLGFFVARFLATGLRIRGLGVLILAGSLCASFGVLDEFHQMFLQGRGAEFRDVLWDLVGGSCGSLFYLVPAGLAKWIGEFLCSREVSLATVLGRAAVTLTLLVGVCVPTVVYADTIADFFTSLVHEGTRYATGIIETYLEKSQSAPQTRQHLTELLRYVETKKVEIAKAVPAQAETQPETVTSKPKQEVKLSASVAPEVVEKLKQEISLRLRAEIVDELRSEVARELKAVEHNSDKPGSVRAMLAAAITSVAHRNSMGGTDWGTTTPAGQNGRVRSPADKVSRTPKASPGVINKRRTSVKPHLLGVGSREPEPCDLVAVIVHPSTTLSELTTDQVRKIFSGEYDNWMQVGGSDLPIKVVSVRKASGDLERSLIAHLGAPLTPKATRVPFLSFMVPIVSETEGAVGFLPVKNTEQLDFVAGHDAFKRIAIKRDDSAPAVTPNRMALNTGYYPIMKDSGVAALARR